MTAELWLFLGLGGFLGYFVGRVRAEVGRARHDQGRTWNQRKNYRR